MPATVPTQLTRGFLDIHSLIFLRKAFSLLRGLIFLQTIEKDK
jgi:hypothetical protein